MAGALVSNNRLTEHTYLRALPSHFITTVRELVEVSGEAGGGTINSALHAEELVVPDCGGKPLPLLHRASSRSQWSPRAVVEAEPVSNHSRARNRGRHHGRGAHVSPPAVKISQCRSQSSPPVTVSTLKSPCRPAEDEPDRNKSDAPSTARTAPNTAPASGNGMSFASKPAAAALVARPLDQPGMCGDDEPVRPRVAGPPSAPASRQRIRHSRQPRSRAAPWRTGGQGPGEHSNTSRPSTRGSRSKDSARSRRRPTLAPWSPAPARVLCRPWRNRRRLPEGPA